MEGQFINTHVHISKIFDTNISYILTKPAYLKAQISYRGIIFEFKPYSALLSFLQNGLQTEAPCGPPDS